MVTTPTSAEQRVLLNNISWQTFETLLAEMGDNRASRLAYDQGQLEIMTPLMPHEHWNRLIERLIFVLAEELNLEIYPTGSTTFKLLNQARGAEPDSSFYIQNAARVTGKRGIDLTQDPPPDLVVEIDITSSSLNRFQIYAGLGVPELWRYDERELQIYQLREQQYFPCDRSATFAALPLTEIPRFLEESQKVGVVAMIRSFRAWVIQQLNS